MSVWRYRSESRGHVWEFVTLGYERVEAREQLRAAIANDQHKFMEFIADNRDIILDLVQAPPSRRKAMLRRSTQKDDELSQIALILGAWQHCRKAVLAFTWLMDHDERFSPGVPYRSETVRQGLLFDQLRSRKWTHWPFQWGPSPFTGEKYHHRYNAPDFDEVMDNFDPETGMY